MNSLMLMPHARTALIHGLKVQAGERLVILWDETVSSEFVQACRIAAEAIQAEATLIVYKPNSYRPLKEYCFFAGASLRRDRAEVPAVVAAAMMEASATLLLTSDMELIFSPLLPALLTAGHRILFVPYLDTSTAYRVLPTTREELELQRILTERIGGYFEKARMAHVSSSEGTDIRMRLGQWEVRRRYGSVGRSEFALLPPGQVTRVPDDNSAEGVIVIDRTIAANDYKELREPITLHVEKGDLVHIEGGMEARLLREFLAGLQDARSYHLTELWIGTNPKCRFSGIGAPTEDTHKWGTVSLALGCDTHIGGGTPAPVHVDMTMRFPSLALDDWTIVGEGRLLVSS